jgi:anti-sigma factor RsiW
MDERQSPSLDEARLHAYVDGQLAPAERDAVEAALAADPEAAATVRAWSLQRALLQNLHAEVLQQPAPVPQAQAAREAGRAAAGLARWRRWGGMAAAVLLAVAAGGIGRGAWDDPSGAGLARARPVQEFGRQALVAHVVFAPEVRHPVEVPAAQQEHLVQWLSKRLGRPLKVPDLAAQGYELVGGRLLAEGQGPRAQFMYQNPRGERLTLYVGALDAREAAARETAFRFTSESGASSFYWVDNGYGYALAGRLQRAELLPLAEAVYRQL